MAENKIEDWQLGFREEPRDGDREALSRILESSGIFYPCEVEVGLELLDERLKRGASSDYYFVFAEAAGEVVGYSAYGPIPMTKGSFDFYWMAVQHDLRGRGIGKQLLTKTEEVMAAAGAERIYIETSSRKEYIDTRAFYQRSQYTIEAVLKDFYAVGDDKLIYVKKL